MSESQSAVPPAMLSADLDENIATIRSRLGNASDLLVSEHRSKSGIRYAVFCIDGLSSRLLIQEHLLESLIGSDADKANLPVQEVRTTGLLDEVLIGILSGGFRRYDRSKRLRANRRHEILEFEAGRGTADRGADTRAAGRLY
ncbi:hypothetical protein [Cohnella rhizosphaerae]|uniref:hypothetical protein n=1 Tax=Cohnella rhizosphaerae TaxID=1457232 RepID=UPI0030B8EB9E